MMTMWPPRRITSSVSKEMNSSTALLTFRRGNQTRLSAAKLKNNANSNACQVETEGRLAITAKQATVPASTISA